MERKMGRYSERGTEVWSRRELKLLRGLDRPEKIQAYLDGLAYSAEDACRSPRRVMRDGQAHCMDGALIAAAALRLHGKGCRVLDLYAVRDDDHIVALFKERGCWGAVSKSNFSGLRFREPVYRTLRELVMSYFDSYFNTEREKTLRSYSRPVDLRRFDATEWMTTERDVDDPIGKYLTATPHTPLLTPAMVRALRPVDRRTYDAAMVGADPAGLYRP